MWECYNNILYNINPDYNSILHFSEVRNTKYQNYNKYIYEGYSATITPTLLQPQRGFLKATITTTKELTRQNEFFAVF